MKVDFEWRFENWLRWCRLGGLRGRRCGSAEGGYRSPQVWWPEGARGEGVDVVDAVEMNRSYWGLPVRVRRVVQVLWFRGWWRPQWQAQKLGVHWTKLGELGHWAKRCWGVRLALGDRGGMILREKREFTGQTVLAS